MRKKIGISFVWPLENSHSFISPVKAESGKKQCKCYRRVWLNFCFSLPSLLSQLGCTLEDRTPHCNGGPMVVGSKGSREDLSLACPRATWKIGTRQLSLLCVIHNSPRVEKLLCKGRPSKILKGKWRCWLGQNITVEASNRYIQVCEKKRFFGELDY